MVQFCAVCGVSAVLKCGGCKNIVYCGKEHQKVHWKSGHKNLCKIYEITSNDKFGRHCIASRDIKQNEIILREQPLVLGPKVVSPALCLGCNQNLELTEMQTDFFKCSKCKWPLCSKNCEKSKFHVAECNLLYKSNYQCQISYVAAEKGKKESAYCTIVPLRILLLKNENPTGFKEFMNLEDHLDQRINTPLYKILKLNLVSFVRNVLGLVEFDERTILKVAAILDTNSFEVRPLKQQSKIRAVYTKASMFSHDCVPNTRHIFTENYEMLLVATVDIPKGSVINVTYTQPLKNTLDRQEHLKQAKCFECSCMRCSDPTELKTYFGAINCSRCKTGKIISTDSSNLTSVWKCEICDHEIAAKQIKWGNTALQTEIASLNKNDPMEFEQFLVKYAETLHPLNCHVIQIKYALTQLYGNVRGFMLSEMTDAAIQRKINLCEELLKVAEIFEPGASRFRGLLLLDLQECLTVQTKREFNNDLLTKENAQAQLVESMNLLQEAVSILKIESAMQSILEDRVKNLAFELE
ncbi:SET domain-containing protein SmydA-8, isoform A [Pseudolycoriella hygida]|uniref:SET domain-containing protein SmydA-8, isoform A n=1 Tax=Pseudolycoriella hygida TaxID=35572 RepID=A0A9Q0MNE2_9DIPT|nr:SET domain-containing protein SmydA-8, isoform A [Pseudolycoriella hygida]